MEPREIIKHYLSQRYMLQLATVAGSQPWVCTVYFVVDGAYNIYWASLPSRRHSQEISQQPNVAAAVPCEFVNGKPVVGLQIEGSARMLEKSDEIQPVAKTYAAKFGRDKQWVEDFSQLLTGHRLYKLRPRRFVLFDELHMAGDPRHEFTEL